MSQLVVIDHPLIAHKLSLMRSKETPSVQFRTLLREISMLLGYEVLRDLPTELRDIETPVGPTRARFLKGKKLVFVPILRALRRATAATAEWPVASMGSTRIVSRSPMSPGTLQ